MGGFGQRFRGPSGESWPKVATYTAWLERRGSDVGRVAAARKFLTLVSYGLRDGQIRCLAKAS